MRYAFAHVNHMMLPGQGCYGRSIAKDAKVAGFLPIDWNQDGAMDLLIGAWGLSHLKLFIAGWCILDCAECILLKVRRL